MIETPSLVDQYCHGVLRTELGLGTFEAQLARTEGPPAPGTTFFDTQTGFAVRRWCPPLLGLEPHCPPARYLARRRELGVLEAAGGCCAAAASHVSRRHRAARRSHRARARWPRAGAAEAHEIVRLELLAEQVADTSGTVGVLPRQSRRVRARRRRERRGLHLGGGRTARPRARARAARARARCAARPGAGWPRGRVGGGLTDPCCCAICCGSRWPRGCRSNCTRARRTGSAHRPHRPGPAHRLRPRHGRPRHRPGPAARLSVPPPRGPPRPASSRTSTPTSGAALVRTGARAAAVLAEILELAPFGKVLFSSGAHGLPELHVVGARLFREALPGCWAAGSPRAPGRWRTRSGWRR